MRALALFAVLACGAVEAEERHRFPEARRVVAFGDVHGAHGPLVRTLRAADIIDAEGRWNGGTTHLVSVGDLLDRGPESRKVLDLLMRLEGEAASAGGRVHVLLGNHELMTLGGELRDASAAEFAEFAPDEPAAEREAERAGWLARQAGRAAPDALHREFETRFPPGWFARRRAFSPEGRYGRWLLERPVVVVVGDSAFAHGGFSPVLAGYDLDRLNREFRAGIQAHLDAVATLERAGWIGFETPGEARAEVVAARLKSAGSTVEPALAAAARTIAAFDAAPLYGVRGPVWYRGLALCRDATERDVVDAMLAQFDVERLVLGHSTTPARRPTSRFDGRVLLIDTGMLASVYRGRGHAIELGAGGIVTIDENGTRGSPLAAVHAMPGSPAAGEATLARTLLAADVVARAPLEGERELLTLAHGGARLEAWFYPDRDGGGRRARELAAYRLDRLLGLGLVPVTVERDIGGVRGAVQWRPERLAGATDPVTAPRWCGGDAELGLLYAWDALILNEGRTASSVHWAGDEGLLLATDHRRAFGRGRGKPSHLANRRITLGPELCRRFAALDAERLRTAFDGAITAREQEALLRRRDRLVGEAGCARTGGPRGAH